MTTVESVAPSPEGAGDASGPVLELAHVTVRFGGITALDDVNLHRFLDLVHEFRNDAQLLIVSHQKRTMEAGDCLYGVSMAPGGSTKVVSQRMRGEIVLT